MEMVLIVYDESWMSYLQFKIDIENFKNYDAIN